MISANLAASLSTFNASTAAAAPIAQASSLTKAALVRAGQQLLSDVEAEAESDGPLLDQADPAGYAGDMIGQMLALSAANDDQAALVEVRGFVGRAVFNLGQA